jgi:hypothetical protein
MNKYFADKKLIPSDVKAIEVDKQRMNCFEVVFKLNDDTLVRVGPFSGETMRSLVNYWTEQLCGS